MRKRPGQVLTVLFGIALGAAVFTSVRLSIHASLDAFTNSMNLIAGQADRVIVQPGSHVSEKIVPFLLNHPAIETASPIITTYCKPRQAKAEPFLLIGFDPILDRPVRSWQVSGKVGSQMAAWMDLLKKPYTMLIGKSLALKYNLAPGDSLTVEHANQTAVFKIVGELFPGGLALVDKGLVAITDIATFQEFTGLHGKVDRVDIIFKADVKEDKIEELESALPESLVMNSPSATQESGQEMIRSYQLNLSILSFASLFVGMFLVYSLIALNAASRRHELAVLRSTGASSYFLLKIFLAEGALLGIVGWLLAMPISGFLIKYMLYGVSQTISTLFVKVQVGSLVLSIWEVMLSMVVTVCISILAAWQPAREAMLVSPKEALEISQHGMLKKKTPYKLALGGMICIVLVFPLSMLPGFMGIPLPGYLAILLLFVGFAMLSPYFLTRLGYALSPLLYRTAGVPAYLAGRYIRDSGNRTAISVGALITAVALFTSLVIMIFSFRQTVEIWTFQTVSGDLFLTPKLNGVNQFRHIMTPETTEWFKQMDKSVQIVPNHRYFLQYGNVPYEFEVLDLAAFLDQADFFWITKSSVAKVRNQLIRGEGVGISEVFSNRTGLKVGDVFSARIGSSQIALPVLAIVRDYRTRGGVVFYSLNHFTQRYHAPGWSGIRLYIKEHGEHVNDKVAVLRGLIIDRWGDKLEIINGRDLRESILMDS